MCVPAFQLVLQAFHRQTHDIAIGAGDLLHDRLAVFLNGVGPALSNGMHHAQVTLDALRGEWQEGHRGALGRVALPMLSQAQRRWRSPPGAFAPAIVGASRRPSACRRFPESLVPRWTRCLPPAPTRRGMLGHETGLPVGIDQGEFPRRQVLGMQFRCLIHQHRELISICLSSSARLGEA